MASVPARVKFLVYALLITAGAAIFGWLSGGQPAWVERRFAMGAIVVQIVELVAAWFLRSYDLGRYSWFGCILPAPAFLLALYFLGWELRASIPGTGLYTAMAFITAAWLGLVIILAGVLHAFDNPFEDRRFATDFALMTGCTAAVFVPICLS
jgi:hypothetical protein